MSNRQYFDGKGLTIRHLGDYLLHVTLPDGTAYEKVEPRRLFPVFNKDKYVSLVYGEGKDTKEIGIIRDVEMLEHSSYLALNAALDAYYMIPKIYEIVNEDNKGADDKWDIITSHGRFSIYIKNRQQDIKLLANNRIIIRDANDNRYEIPDYTKMTAKSQGFLIGEI